MLACVAGQDCPQAPDFDDEDERHADHLQHEPKRLLLDHRLPHQLHPPSRWGGNDHQDQRVPGKSEL